MTSHYAALNRNLERLKMGVQKRKQQRRDWMQQLMNDTVSQRGNAVDNGCETGDRAVNSELELVPVDSLETNSASVAPSCEREQGQPGAVMLGVASKQASDNSMSRLH